LWGVLWVQRKAAGFFIFKISRLSMMSGGEGGIDSPPLAAHPCGAHSVRPKLLRNFVEHGFKPLHLPLKTEKGPDGPFCVFLAERAG
jgi:hypothetical protein